MTGSVRVIRHPAPAKIDAAAHELILTAIHNKKLLRFLYKDELRIVEPQDYGIQKGVVNLFTYQIGGKSSSGSLPDWRKFVVQKISRLELLEQSFNGSRLVPTQKHQDWDVLFARVGHF
jgi:predicted DNA-binding transcriptional regulator YafY